MIYQMSRSMYETLTKGYRTESGKWVGGYGPKKAVLIAILRRAYGLRVTDIQVVG